MSASLISRVRTLLLAGLVLVGMGAGPARCEEFAAPAEQAGAIDVRVAQIVATARQYEEPARRLFVVQAYVETNALNRQMKTGTPAEKLWTKKVVAVELQFLTAVAKHMEWPELAALLHESSVALTAAIQGKPSGSAQMSTWGTRWDALVAAERERWIGPGKTEPALPPDLLPMAKELATLLSTAAKIATPSK